MTTDTVTVKKPWQLNNKIYNKLVWVAQILLPLIGTIMFLNTDHEDSAVANSISYILMADLGLGLLLQFARYRYMRDSTRYDGSITLEETEDKKTFSLNLNTDPNDLEKKKIVTFQVKVN